MTTIEPLHRFAYDSGTDPIEYAVELARVQIETSNDIRTARIYSPNAYPIFLGSLGDDAVARRVIAQLLDAGWTPPDPEQLTEETRHDQDHT